MRPARRRITWHDRIQVTQSSGNAIVKRKEKKRKDKRVVEGNIYLKPVPHSRSTCHTLKRKVHAYRYCGDR